MIDGSGEHSIQVGATRYLPTRGFDTGFFMRAVGWTSMDIRTRHLEHAEHPVRARIRMRPVALQEIGLPDLAGPATGPIAFERISLGSAARPKGAVRPLAPSLFTASEGPKLPMRDECEDGTRISTARSGPRAPRDLQSQQ